MAESLLGRQNHVIDADLSQYFDTIPHAKLMATVAERISDGAVLALIQQWLKAGMVEDDQDGTRRHVGGGKANRKGTPQGGVISPLLANLYLHLLDRIWERHQYERRYRARLVRFADDMVICCARDAERPQAVLRHVLDRLALTLNETKTHTVNAYAESFDFVGFNFQLRQSRRSGKYYPHVEPCKKAVQSIKDRTRELTDRRRTSVPMPIMMKEVNQAVRGWGQYFHHRNSTNVFRQVKMQVEERVRTQLRRRHKLTRAQAYERFPTHTIYGQYGLYKLPTYATWRSAGALV